MDTSGNSGAWIAWIMILLIAGGFGGTYYYFKLQNAKYKPLVDREFKCDPTQNGNPVGQACGDLIKGGSHVSSEADCRATCDTTPYCNAYSYDRSHGTCFVRYYYPTVETFTQVAKQGTNFGYKITPTPKSS